MGLRDGHRKNSLHGSSSLMVDSANKDEAMASSEEGDATTNIISQPRPGVELLLVSRSAFVLGPQSMLIQSPHSGFSTLTIDDPVKRFVEVTKFYLSSRHVRPTCLKKPLSFHG